MRQWSIRRRISVWTAFVVAIALLLFGAETVWEVYKDQIKDIDRQMESEVHALFVALNHERKDPEDRDEVDALLEGMRDQFVEIVRQDGKLYHRSPNLGDRSLDSRKPPEERYNTSIGEKRVRVGAFEKQGIKILIGVDLQTIDHTMGELIRAFILALPVVLLALSLGCWWIARQALQPIENITRDAEKITARHLDHRLPVLDAHNELGRLALVLNRMFDRLETGFHEVAQFTSDAAHELRTPLAIMRGEIEAEARSGTYNPSQEKFLISMLDDNAHLSTIVANLLLLSRADIGRLDLKLREVDCSTLIQEAVEDAEILAAPFHITIRAEVSPGVCVIADRARLRQVLLNLFDNAVKYNRTDGAVTVRLSKVNGTARFSIANTGSAIPADRAARIFQRFFRGDPAHSDVSAGQGLGLSICRELIHAHDGRIELAENSPDHIELRIQLPSAAG